MIVKNEEAGIRCCLGSALLHVNCYVICDTGSSDASLDVGHSVARELAKPGHVARHEWRNFGHNRALSARVVKEWATEQGFASTCVHSYFSTPTWGSASPRRSTSLSLDPVSTRGRFREAANGTTAVRTAVDSIREVEDRQSGRTRRARGLCCLGHAPVIRVRAVSGAQQTLTVLDRYDAVGRAFASLTATETKAREIVVLPVNGRSLELLVARAQRFGPVLVVAADDQDVERAFRAGADDVLMRDDLGARAIRTALRRALARREGLLRRDLRASADRQALTASTLEILIGGACVQVEGALENASERCEALCELVRQGMLSELRAATGSGARRSRGRGRRESPRGSNSGVTAESVEEVREALRAALETCGRVKSLVLPKSGSYLDLREAVLELTALVRPAIETVAEFVVRVPDDRCVVRVARWQAVQAIGGLLTNAVSAARERGGNRYIELRMVREHRDVAVEIADDGVGLSESQVQGIFQGAAPYAVNPALVRFAFAAAIARHASGELLLTSSPSAGTTARMYLGLHEPARVRE